MAEKGYYGLWFYLESDELNLEERTGLLSLHNTAGEAEAALDRQVQSAIEEWTAGAFAHDEENICVDDLSFGSTGFGKKLYDCDYPEEFNAWFVEWVKAPEERSTTKSDQSSAQQHLTLAKASEERSTIRSDYSRTQPDVVSLRMIREPIVMYYSVGDTLELAGLLVEATLSDGSTLDLGPGDFADSIKKFTVVGDEYIILKYGGKTTKFWVSVLDN